MAGASDPITPAWERPDQSLLRYYLLTSLLAGPFFFVPLIPLYFRYHTMRYVFDDEGVSMRWGVFFRREISLAYARLQDIHLTSNVVERWLGLAKVQLQTASGSAKAEMTIEGLPDFESVRDFLYGKMRGSRARRASASAGDERGAGLAGAASGDAARLVPTLQALTEELGALRAFLERGVTREERRLERDPRREE